MNNTNLNFLQRSKFQNIAHSAVLLSAMLLLLTIIGWLVAGVTGIIMALAMGIFLAISSSIISSKFILSLYHSRPLKIDEVPKVYEMLIILCKRAGLNYQPTLYYIPSRIINSFATGHGKNTVIAISDGMLNNLTMRELVSIIGHEISHLRNNDLWLMGLADIISRLTSILATVGYFLILIYFPIYLLTDAEIPWALLILLLLAPHFSALLQLALSRSREFGADLFAAEITGDALGLASALTKIDYYESGLFKRFLQPNRQVTNPSLLRTHPETRERVARLRKYAEQQQEILSNFNYLPFKPPTTRLPLRSPRRRYHGLWY